MINEKRRNILGRLVMRAIAGGWKSLYFNDVIYVHSWNNGDGVSISWEPNGYDYFRVTDIIHDPELLRAVWGYQIKVARIVGGSNFAVERAQHAALVIADRRYNGDGDGIDAALAWIEEELNSLDQYEPLCKKSRAKIKLQDIGQEKA